MGLRNFFQSLGLAAMVAVGCAGSGCATMKTAGKVLVTPVAVARDVVDLPLYSTANFFELMAESCGPSRSHSGVGWSSRSGWGVGGTIDITYPVSKTLSYTFGGVDYIVGRSFVPFPEGTCPWVREEKNETFGKKLFPNTKALWKRDD